MGTESLNLNNYLLPENAPITQDRGFVSALSFDLNYEYNPFAQPITIFKGAVSSRHYITLIEAGASGGAQTSYFTSSGSASPQGLDASRIRLNPADFPNNKFFLEAVYRAGTTGESARTFFMDFYDITGGSVIAQGTFSGTSQSGTGFNVYPRERSTVDFRPSLPAGNREYILRYWGTSASGTTFVDLYQARLIIDFAGTA